MSVAYVVHDIKGTAYTIPFANVSQVIESNPYDKMRGVNQYIQLINGTLVGTTSLGVTETNKQILTSEAGIISSTEIDPYL